MFNKLSENPLKSRDDLKRAVYDIVSPLIPLFSESKAGIKVGSVSAHYSENIACLEAFARPLWAIAPLIAGGSGKELAEIYREGIKNGTNPAHKDYWGEPQDFDQRLVEMAAFGLSLIIAPEEIWEPLDEQTKTNFYNWLNFINEKKLCNNNWQLFAVLVNEGFKKIGMPYNSEVVNSSLNAVEGFYLSNGWYTDGTQTRCDYYIAFAIHFYLLIYAKYENGELSETIKSRAAVFANDFIRFFSESGAAVAFGRSMTYKFAQAAFWSAYAFADVKGIEKGVVKGIILRNLRSWFALPIFQNDGTLCVGYGYPSNTMTENYNAHGSPYWALKTMLILAIPETDEFWQCEELAFPKISQSKAMPYAGFIAQRTGGIAVLYNGGFDNPKESVGFIDNFDSKYEKLAYSSHSGFGIHKVPYDNEPCGFDNALAFDEYEGYFRTKNRTLSKQITDDYIIMKWQPYNDVFVKTVVIPAMPYDVRVHFIDSKRRLRCVEGGFACNAQNADTVCDETKATVCDENAVSAITDLFKTARAGVHSDRPNTNLLYSQSCFPFLEREIKPGKSVLASAVYYAEKSAANGNPPLPKLSLNETEICVEFPDKTVVVCGCPKDSRNEINPLRDL